jgi:membrane-associated phospholipid phosphatase
MPAVPPLPQTGETPLRLTPRLGVHWIGKMLGTTLGMTGFFVAYFWVLHHPASAVTVMPLTFLDRWIPFQPLTLPLYLSLWVYVSLAPALLVDRRELISYGLVAIIISVIGLGIFYFWPTAVPVPDINWAQHPSVSFLKAVDASGNVCPSLHVAFAVFTGIWFQRILTQMRLPAAWRWANWLWCLGIVYSTIAIRQHVALDVLAGVALGAVAGLLHLRLLTRRTR